MADPVIDTRLESLDKARTAQDDEFFTDLYDVGDELQHYEEYFENKFVFCNCDYYETSAFFTYFNDSFERLGLRKLVCMGVSPSGEWHMFIRSNDGMLIKKQLDYCGFESDISIAALQRCDVVVTNPPFSIYRDFIELVIDNAPHYIVLGTILKCKLGKIMEKMRQEKCYTGHTHGTLNFHRPDEGKKKVFACWYQNVKKPIRNLVNVNEGLREYDNFHVLSIDRLRDIPSDYEGVIGVPITYCTIHNDIQFNILGFSYDPHLQYLKKKTYKGKQRDPVQDGKVKFARIFIQYKKKYLETQRIDF